MAPTRLHWFLPSFGDSRDILQPAGRGTASRHRAPDAAYLGQVARSAEQLGFEAALVPTGSWCEDAWVLSSMLVSQTARLKYLVALRPGLMSPTLAAQMAATFQEMSGGRLMLNVVTGGESADQRKYGDHEGKSARYARCAEFLDICRELWSSADPVDHHGDWFDIERAHLANRPSPVPPLYLGGSSDAALDVASGQCDSYLTWGEPPAAVAEKFAAVRARAEARGRTLSYGVRLHVIARDTSEEAWAEADKMLRRLPNEQIERVQRTLQRSESEGQQRMLDLHGGDVDSLLVGPNLWAGVGLGRGGAGTALVGSHSEIADRIEEYVAAGADEFVLSGYPHLEEAYWFGEGVMPLLEERGLWRHPDNRDDTTSDRVSDGRVPFAAA